MPKPSSLGEEEAMGDDGARCRGVALESTASRTLTTHSSPCDVSDEEDLHLVLPHASKRVDDHDTINYNYQSVETPRGSISERASIRSIQIQIESVPRRLSSDLTSKRRRLCGRHSGSSDKKTTGLTGTWWELLVPLLVVVGPPALVLVLLHFSVAYTILLVLNVAVALAGWEWSWWSFRIRQRLIVPFLYAETSTTLERHGGVEEFQDGMLNQEVLAIKKLAQKCGGRTYTVACGLTVIATTVVVTAVTLSADWIIPQQKSVVGRRVLVSSTTTGMLSGAFCACLAPTLADACILVVYLSCFVVSSLNSFLAHHEHLVHDPELLDSLYVLLVGACAVVVTRIVSSKEVMESTMMAMLDILGLAYLVAPMMAMADFLGHPTVKDYGDVVGTFFVVVSAAEAAYWINATCRDKYPQFLQRCRRPISKNMSKTLGIESLLLSFTFGIAGAIISVLCFHGYIIEWQDALVYLGAIFMSQFCRLALESMKTMAKLENARYKPWVGGFMELLNPYLLAMIVFHPYVKALIKK